MVVHRGGCHCGAVRFEVEAPPEIDVKLCNCSVCSMVSYLHLIVPKSRFRLLSGQDSISTYTFNTGVAQHYFCRVCGIKSFYVPRSNPEGISVNARCLARDTIKKINVASFDGQNWEANAESLAHLAVDTPSQDGNSG